MSSSSEVVHRMTDESSARLRSKCGRMSRRPHQPKRRIEAKRHHGTARISHRLLVFDRPSNLFFMHFYRKLKSPQQRNHAAIMQAKH
ncbi:unnamed protein product [Protopolystoma xenopodis]|uniref:Uncharacterized protein n=1 Tax=Protopolystoma xenopodis TaxID=117903 RepID=A0A3S5CBW8_9PLAT|nr:unnamed protein product [Protopolystoma xenopodis]